MKKNILFFLIFSSSLISYPISAEKPSYPEKVIHYAKKSIGVSLLIVGIPLLLSGISFAIQSSKTDPSVKIWYKLFTSLSLAIGIPSTILGLLLVIPDKQSSTAGPKDQSKTNE